MSSENFRSEVTHKETNEDKERIGAGDENTGDEKFVWGEEGKIKEVANEWNSDGKTNNTDNNGEQNRAEQGEWPGN